MGQFFSVEKDKNDIAVVTFNRSDKEMNILSEQVLRELADIVLNISSDRGVAGVVFISGKKDHFIVGADITEIEKLGSETDAAAGSRAMQSVFQKIAELNVPTVAAIHGPTLGGGLEMSLACSWRVATNDPKTKMGLPEIQLGIIPGAGGTQRLPRLIGIQPALDMILTAKRVDGNKALKMGLVDACVPSGDLLKVATSYAMRAGRSQGARTNSLSKELPKLLLEGNMMGRRLMEDKAKKMTLEKTKGFYPAAIKAIDAVFRGFDKNLLKGLEIEAELFGQLVPTTASKSLVHLYHATTAGKKTPYKSAGEERFKDADVETIGIIGAGFMGGGIANVCADKGYRIFVSDPNRDAHGRLLKASNKFFYKKVERRRLKAFEADSKIAHITPMLAPTNFQNLDIVIEAVFEDLGLKQKILAQVEAGAHKDWVFASNTSALPISQIAEKSKSPERVLGMHFFSPVEKMPLLEIVVTDKTAPWATARAIEVGNKMGKTLIVVKDSPGFYTTRILAFYLCEAALMLQEGASVEALDEAMEKFGFPVGPMTLVDEVGFDVGIHVLETMQKAFSDRFKLPEVLRPLADSGRLGRKNSKGFYVYAEGKKGEVDDSVYAEAGIKVDSSVTQESIVDRCGLVFVNESVRCLEEGILANAYDGDVGAVFGLGFPPFLGGPFKYIDHMGAQVIVEKLEALSAKFGSRFAPAALLKKMASEKKRFFPEEA
jgi:3-hydroxyacyl-CoA dehydrogenase/enoyl-CoA hydratase/3-hydroxybutyryl-CoA epimerase